MVDMSDPPAPPRRRWFQFRLRTLLIATALLSIATAWFGWQLRIVRNRQSLLALMHAREPVAWTFLDMEEATPLLGDEPAHPLRVPWFREMLGDKPLRKAPLDAPLFSREEIRQIREAFPETEFTTGTIDEVLRPRETAK
jgi:hypothetical protein